MIKLKKKIKNLIIPILTVVFSIGALPVSVQAASEEWTMKHEFTWDSSSVEASAVPEEIAFEVVDKDNSASTVASIKLNSASSWKGAHTATEVLTFETLEELNQAVSNYFTRYIPMGTTDVIELSPNGSPVIDTATKTATASFNVTYTPAAATTKEISAKVVFNDAGNEAGRGDGVNLYLFEKSDVNKAEISGTRLSNFGQDKTKYEFTANWTVPSSADYSIFCSTLSNYDVAVDAITNTYTFTPKATANETITLKIKLVWDDNNNASGKRPQQIVAQLYDGTEKVAEPFAISEASASLELDKKRNGKDADYSVQLAENIAGYEAKIEKDAEGFVITLKNAPELVDVKLKINWNDSNNASKQRPDKVKVQLYAGNDKVGNEVEITNTTWEHTFEKLNSVINGKKAEYTAKITNLSTDYTYDAKTENNVITINCTHKNMKTEVAIAVEWKNADTSAKKPENITVALLADGKETGKTVTLNNSNNFYYKFADLDKFNSSGTEIKYSVKCNDIAGYTITPVESQGGFVLSVARTDTNANAATSNTTNNTANNNARNAANEQQRAERVQTGDDNNVIFYIIGAVLFLALATTSVVVLKKRNK